MKCVDCGGCQKGWNESKPDKYYCLGVKEPFEIYDIYAECTEYPDPETIEGCKYERKYSVLIDQTVVASYMDLKTATILARALFEEYYNDHLMVVSIREEDRCAAETAED